MSGNSLKVTNTIDQSAPPSLRIDDAPRESNERNLFSDFAGPVIVFILFIGFWYLLSTKLLPPQKRFCCQLHTVSLTKDFLLGRPVRNEV